MAEEIKTVELYFDGVKKVCSVQVDRNDEYVCTVPTLEQKEGEAEVDNSLAGRFRKFPKGDFKKMVEEDNVIHGPQK